MFSRIVPTIEATTISPIGTKTVTLSDRQVSVAGSRSTPSFESASAPMPRMARTSAAPSKTFPAISTLEGIPGGGATESSISPNAHRFLAWSESQEAWGYASAERESSCSAISRPRRSSRRRSSGMAASTQDLCGPRNAGERDEVRLGDTAF